MFPYVSHIQRKTIHSKGGVREGADHAGTPIGSSPMHSIIMKPQQKARDYLKRLGYEVWTVEQTIRIPGGRTFKRDLFGFADLLAINKRGELVAIQVTDNTSVSKHMDKLRDQPEVWETLKTWLVYNQFWIMGWRRGTRTKRMAGDLRLIKFYKDMSYAEHWKDTKRKEPF